MSLGVGGIVSVGGSSAAGGGSGSGIQVINPGNNTGPTVEFQGVNGVTVTSPSPNVVLIDGGALSGLIGAASTSGGCYSANFGPTTSGKFDHNLGTRNLVIEVRDNSGPPVSIIPDSIIFDTLDAFSLLFNTPQIGSVTALSCGSNTGVASSGITKFIAVFSDQINITAIHNIGTEDIIVQIYNDNKIQIIPDEIEIIDMNRVTIRFNALQSGKIIILG